MTTERRRRQVREAVARHKARRIKREIEAGLRGPGGDLLPNPARREGAISGPGFAFDDALDQQFAEIIKESDR